jgi:hypothetical protein
VSVLGCPQTYTALLHWQGGGRQFTALSGVTDVQWERKLDDTSQAVVQLTKGQAAPDCLRRVGKAEPWSHELTLYRDTDLVWQGPLFDYTENRTTIALTARDSLAWLSRRAVHADLGWDGNAAACAEAIIIDALSPDDPGLLDYLDVLLTGSPNTQREVVQGKTQHALAQLAEVAQAGLDYYTVGRAIYVRPDKVDYGVRPIHLRPRHFKENFQVRKVGSETSTKHYVVGTPPEGAVDGTPSPVGEFGGLLPGIGLVETISSAGNTSDPGILTAVARKVVGYGSPTPITITLPDQSGLVPTAPATIHELVPGRYFQVAVTEYALRMQALMKLTQVSVQWAPGAQEVVNISMIPKDVYDLPA